MPTKRLPQDLHIRRLHASDQQTICDHFLRLDARTRRARFCGAANDSGVLKYARHILRRDSIVCGAFVGEHLRGLGELRGLFHSWPSTTEAAFTVEQDWQNIGIGDALFDRIFAMAQNRGVRKIQMICLRDNHRMQHLASKHHARLLLERDVVEAELRAKWPTPGSIAKEIIGEAKEYSHLIFR